MVSEVVNALAALLDGRTSSADPQTPASVTATEERADPRAAGAGSESPEAEIRATNWSTGSSSVHEAARSGTLEAGSDDLWPSRSGVRPVMDASGRLWPKILGAVRGEAAWVVRGGIVSRWLEVAAALAGLGALGGAFALRRRFLG